MGRAVEQIWKALNDPESDMLEIKSRSGYKDELFACHIAARVSRVLLEREVECKNK